jgi:hypothetical protein
VSHLETASQQAAAALSGKTSEWKAKIDAAGNGLRSASEDAGTILADRTADLRTAIVSAGGQLNAAAADASGALTAQAEELKTVITSAGGLLNAAVADASGALAAHATELKTAIVSAGGQLNAAVADTSGALSMHAAELKTAITSAGGQLNAAAADAGSALAQHTAEMKITIESAGGQLSAAAKGVGSALTAHATELKTAIVSASGQLNAAAADAGSALAQHTADMKITIESAGGQLSAAAKGAGGALTAHATELKTAIASAGGQLNAAAADAGSALASHTAELKGSIVSAGEQLNAAAAGVSSTLTAHAAELGGAIRAAGEEIRMSSRESAELISSRSEQLKAMVGASGAQIQNTAVTAADMLSAQTSHLQSVADAAIAALRESGSRVAEALSARTSETRTVIEAASTNSLKAAEQLQSQMTEFRDAVAKISAAPLASAEELDRKAALIAAAADAAVARALEIHSRQQGQIAAMNELLGRLQQQEAGLDATLNAQRFAAEKALALLASESKRFDELAEAGFGRVDKAMAEAAARSTQLSSGFTRDAERVKETVDIAATALSRLVEGLRAASDNARALIADSTGQAETRSKKFVGEAMALCEQLLSRVTALSQEAEKTRLTIANAGGEAAKHMADLPQLARTESENMREALRAEAERMRENLRGETEQILNASARALATFQSRIGSKRHGSPDENGTAEPAEADATGEGLRGLARRITAPRKKTVERKGSFELSDVLAAAETREPSRAPLRQSAASALGSLQATLADLSSELIELVGEAADPALWKRYLEGDRGVFARKLAGSIGPKTVDRVTVMYRDNPRFKESVETYLTEFEALLSRARESDRDGFLASTLLTADTGKIYLAVAYALGRLD